MWAWWLIFLLFAGALGYFVAWLILSSRRFNNDSDQNRLPQIPREPKLRSPFFSSNFKSTSAVDSKLNELEYKVNQYASRQYELLSKLEKLDTQPKPPPAPAEEVSEWEEMYYEMRDKKEELEEELEKISKPEMDQQDKLSAFEKSKSKQAESISKNDIDEIEKSNLENIVALLEKKLEASIKREAELNKELGQKMSELDNLRSIKMHNAEMQSELEQLRSYVDVLSKKNTLFETGKSKIAELQFELHNKEDEKKGMREKVEEILLENEKLAEKIKDLQQKLHQETYGIILPGSKN